VYRINRKTKEAFVLYDAAENEVSALALDKNGNLYAGTAKPAKSPARTPKARAKRKISADVPKAAPPTCRSLRAAARKSESAGAAESEPRSARAGTEEIRRDADAAVHAAKSPSVRPVLLADKDDDGMMIRKNPSLRRASRNSHALALIRKWRVARPPAPTRGGPLITGGSVQPRAEGNAIYKIQPTASSPKSSASQFSSSR
jgi:hypothetical protein